MHSGVRIPHPQPRRSRATWPATAAQAAAKRPQKVSHGMVTSFSKQNISYTTKNNSSIVDFDMNYFYILQSKKNSEWFYKGSTDKLQRRVKQHLNGEVTSTKPYLPIELVYYEAYITIDAAREREMAVKKSGSVSVPLLKRIKKSLET